MRLNNDTLAPGHIWIAGNDFDQPNADDAECARNKQIGREGKDSARFTQPSEVCEDEETHGAERKFQAYACEGRNR